MNKFLIPVLIYTLVLFFSIIIKYVLNPDFLNISTGESAKISLYETLNYTLSLIPVLNLKTQYAIDTKSGQLIEFIIKMKLITVLLFTILYKENIIFYAM